MKDFYSILGVNDSASDREIKKAYRDLAKRYHPDRNQGDEAAENKFKEISEAYDTLGDKDKRAQYDMMKNNPGGFFQGEFSSFGDIFGSMFSDRFPQHRKHKKREKTIRLDITLSDLLSGTLHKVIRLRENHDCTSCNGEGGSNKHRCDWCHGTGVIVEQQSRGNMFIQNTQPCHSCRGRGFGFSNVCDQCQGQGQIIKEIYYDMDITCKKRID